MDLLVKVARSSFEHRVKPGDELTFTLKFDRGESSWTVTYDDLLQYVNIKHAILEVVLVDPLPSENTIFDIIEGWGTTTYKPPDPDLEVPLSPPNME